MALTPITDWGSTWDQTPTTGTAPETPWAGTAPDTETPNPYVPYGEKQEEDVTVSTEPVFAGEAMEGIEVKVGEEATLEVLPTACMDIIDAYNMPYDLARAFDIICTAPDIAQNSMKLDEVKKLLKHRVDADKVKDLSEISPRNESASKKIAFNVIKNFNFNFFIGNLVYAIVQYCITGGSYELEGALEALEFI